MAIIRRVVVSSISTIMKNRDHMIIIGLGLIILLGLPAVASADYSTLAAIDCLACRNEIELRKALACAPDYDPDCLEGRIQIGWCIRLKKGDPIGLRWFSRDDGPAYIRIPGQDGHFFVEPSAIPPEAKAEWLEDWLYETTRIKGHAD